ncbi:unnamed protein product [Phytophthora lilii]|uniref:Unnamed protein product n=1 Tax=Phytophthora lilii TaxID=2077276 RepID=A0A9W6UFL0_9STRA|nr:unnamed protein product [Phytophthora lilii]
MTQNATTCSRNALNSGYCRQHDKDEKIRMYRKELARMHQRVRRYLEISNDLNQKLMDIKRLDYIKSRLIMIGGPHMPFRAVLSNPCFKDEVESLFDMDMDKVQDEYDALLARRNELVHPYTLDGLNGKRIKRTYR